MAEVKKNETETKPKSATAAPASTSLKDEPNTSSGQNAGNETDVKLDEGSTIKEFGKDEKADPGEITEGVSADEIPASGSISEKAAVADIPVDHPAVDDNPRKNQPAEANRIDFNDPTFR